MCQPLIVPFLDDMLMLRAKISQMQSQQADRASQYNEDVSYFNVSKVFVNEIKRNNV